MQLFGTTTMGSTWSIASSGDQISGTSEIFHYTYQSLSGDATMLIRVTDFGGYNPYPSAREGVMIRETLEPDSPKVMMAIRGDDGSILWPAFQYRSSKAGSTTENTYSQTVPAGPYWLKLQRAGSQFTGYGSHDGINWNQVGTVSLTGMPSNVYVGLATSPGRTDIQHAATFDNAYVSTTGGADFLINASPATQTIGVGGGNAYYGVLITGLNNYSGTANLSISGLPAGATASAASISGSGSATLQVTTAGVPAGTYPLTINAVSGSLTHSAAVTLLVHSAGGSTLPTPWAHMDIGGVGAQGNASFSAGAFTVQGSGNYIFFTADAFHYAYQPLNGDGTIIGRVASTQNFTGTAKAGLMIRETLTPESANVMIESQATQVSTFQYRNGPSAGSNYNTGTARPWLKLVRSGTNFYGYTSADGASWSQLGSVQFPFPMRSAVYIGLAVGAKDQAHTPPSVVTTGVFDNVQVSVGPDFRPAATPASATGVQGATATYTVAVDPLNGFNGASTPVNFSVTGNPANTTVSWSPSSQWSGSGSLTLTVNVGATAAVGSYPLTITGTSGALTRTTVVTLNVTLPTAATPTFSPAGGSAYSSAQPVTISTTTSGASIRYTTDGTDPTSTTGTLYTGPVTVASTLTLKAIAYKSGYNDSAIGSATYTVLVRTERGKFANKTSNASWTVGNITVSSGEALFVVVGGNASTLPTVTWGGTALTQDNAIQTSGSAAIAIYSLLNPTAGTQSLVVSWSGTIPAARACTVTTVTGLLTSAAVDANVNAKNGNITSTSPSTGASGTSAQAREFVIGGVLTKGPDGDSAGLTNSPFSSGQRLGTTGNSAASNVTVHELYRVTNTTGTSTASKVGITSRTWWAIEQGYKALVP